MEVATPSKICFPLIYIFFEVMLITGIDGIRGYLEGYILLFLLDVCMYVCMYVCMHACMHVCMYACMYNFNVNFVLLYVYLKDKRANYFSLSEKYRGSIISGGNQCRVVSEGNISSSSCYKFSRLYEFAFDL